MPVDVADADAGVRRRPNASRPRSAPIDVWVNVAFTSVFAPFDQITPEEYRRVTEVSYLGYVYAHHGRAEAHEATRPRHDRAGRLGAGLPRHPAADARTAAPSTRSRDSTRRCAANCCTTRATCTSRWCRCRRSTPRSSPGCCPGCRVTPSRCRRSTSPSSPPAACCSPPTIRGAASTGSGSSTMATLAANAIAPGLLDRYLGRTGFTSQQTEQRQRPRRAGEPVGAGRRRGRPRLRRPRHLRRHVARPRSAAVGIAPSRRCSPSLAGAAAAAVALLWAPPVTSRRTQRRRPPARRRARSGRLRSCSLNRRRAAQRPPAISDVPPPWIVRVLGVRTARSRRGRNAVARAATCCVSASPSTSRTPRSMLAAARGLATLPARGAGQRRQRRAPRPSPAPSVRALR